MSEKVIPYASWRAGGPQGEIFPRGPAVWIDDGGWSEAELPRRPWIVPGYLMRGAVTVLAGPPGAGKSLIALAWLVAIGLGRRFGRFRPAGCEDGERLRRRCLNYNVEDDNDEQRRRLSATLRQFDAVPADLAGWLARVGPEREGQLLHVDLDRQVRATEVLEDLERHMEAWKPEVVVLDPLVELHDAEENDNGLLRMVVARLRHLARAYDCAVLVVAHTRKGAGGNAGNADLVRGAGAISGAARVVLTLLEMDEAEARDLGIPADQRRRYFRVDGAKSNYAPVTEAEWFERDGVMLDNGERAPAALPWTPPQPMRDVSPADLNAALDRIAEGPAPGVLYTASKRGGADRWAGGVLMEAAGIGEDQARLLLSAWVRNGLLVEVRFRHPEARRDMVGVRVVDAKRPTV